MESPILQVGYDKGEIDYSLNGRIYTLNQEQLKAFKLMLLTAIGIMEEGLRRRDNEVINVQCGSSK